MDPKILRLLQQHFVGKKIGVECYVVSIDYGDYLRMTKDKSMGYRFLVDNTKGIDYTHLNHFIGRVLTYFPLKNEDVLIHSEDKMVYWYI